MSKLVTTGSVVPVDLLAQTLPTRRVCHWRVVELLTQHNLCHQEFCANALPFCCLQIDACSLQQIFGACDFVGQDAEATVDIGTKLGRHALLNSGLAGVSVGMKLGQ